MGHNPAQTARNAAAMSVSKNPRQFPRPKEIAFVEDELHLNEVWERLEGEVDYFGSLLSKKTTAEGALIGINFEIDNRERDVTNGVLEAAAATEGKAPSQAEIERRVRQALANDELLNSLRQQQIEVRISLIDIDNDVTAVNARQRATRTQLESITAYMEFLRSSRDARTVHEANTPY